MPIKLDGTRGSAPAVDPEMDRLKEAHVWRRNEGRGSSAPLSKFCPVAQRGRKRGLAPPLFEPRRWCGVVCAESAIRRDSAQAAECARPSRLVPHLAGVMHIECWHILAAARATLRAGALLRVGVRNFAEPIEHTFPPKYVRGARSGELRCILCDPVAPCFCSCADAFRRLSYGQMGS